jgi:hypothetical protein
MFEERAGEESGEEVLKRISLALAEEGFLLLIVNQSRYPGLVHDLTANDTSLSAPVFLCEGLFSCLRL